MARPKSLVPKYRQHRASGQAVVTLSDHSGRRRDVYLGAFGTDASKSEYARVIAEWQVSRSRPVSTAGLSVAEVLVAYLGHAEAQHGADSQEVAEIKRVIKVTREMYGETVAIDFGPRSLKAVRQRIIDSGVCRGVVNQRCGRIVRAFRWATSEELLPPAVYQSLKTVDGLQRHKSAAPEAEPIGPVPDAYVTATLPFLLPPVAAMVELQRLTGMRPGEVCRMRGCDIDVSGPIFLYRPHTHKTKWRGKDRVVALGPKAQAIVRRFLVTETMAYLFSPCRALAEWRQGLRANRATLVQPSQRRRRKRHPKRQPGERYTTQSYRKAINKAAAKANVPVWSPNQLRHARATEVRKSHGLEAAQHVLGHARVSTTEIYAERNASIALKVAAETG